jgi:LacI family transcriptional regulator
MTDVGLRDVAALAGVSVSTVSNALNRPELVSRKAAVRVQDAIERLGYVPNQAARQLKAGRSKTLGLAVMNITNPFFSDIVIGAEEEATAAGYSVILGNSYDSADRELNYLRLFEAQRCDGILLAPVGGDLVRLSGIRRRRMPVVLIDREDEIGSFPSVSLDDVYGGQLAGRHLVEIGCRRIAFVGGPFDVPQMRNRRDGCHAAVSESGTATMSVIPTETLNADLGREIGERIGRMPADERPDGIFAANDVLALGIMQSLLRQGIDVPHEVAIVGYDDIDFAAGAIVPLTSITQPARMMGKRAAQLLIAELEGTAPDAVERLRYEPSLVARESSRRSA